MRVCRRKPSTLLRTDPCRLKATREPPAGFEGFVFLGGLGVYGRVDIEFGFADVWPIRFREC